MALARAGLAIAQGTAAPVLVAELHAMDGRALALLCPLRSASPHLTDLHDRITDFLTHTTRQQHDDNSL